MLRVCRKSTTLQCVETISSSGFAVARRKNVCAATTESRIKSVLAMVPAAGSSPPDARQAPNRVQDLRPRLSESREKLARVGIARGPTMRQGGGDQRQERAHDRAKYEAHDDRSDAA